MANRLQHETSPYLLQHANNPVDWYPWGEEAIQRARREDKPIFLSVGYSACHWCHVMEKESFEDPEIARLLNEHFVCVKVDREERPDIDQIYMNAVQLLTGRGGWPMSVFLTPQLLPFYAGTYWPARSRMGMPGFDQVIRAVAEAWRMRREQVESAAEEITNRLIELTQSTSRPNELEVGLLEQAARSLERSFDFHYGGFGGAPKFPHAIILRFLLRYYQRCGRDTYRQMVTVNLDRMAAGGIYDHLGGGFARYSVDQQWLVPHFEKMLYDNALLANAYLEAYLVTRSEDYRQVVCQTLDYVLRDMRDAGGGFYSSEDADSEGEEGKFYLWTLPEIKDVLGPDLGELFCRVYDVTEIGNFEGKNILHLPKTWAQCAALYGVPMEQLKQQMAQARQLLLERRSQRVRPGKDTKILTSWNAFMIDAMARGGAVFGNSRYVDAAQQAAQFVLTKLQGPEGRLWHCRQGQDGHVPAFLEDYAALIIALLSLYESTFDEHWIDEAVRLADVMLSEFHDEAEGGFYYTSSRHEQVILRMKDFHDSSTPSGNGLAAMGLLQLGHLVGESRYEHAAEQTLKAATGLIGQWPLAAGQLLLAVDWWLGPRQEVVIVGDASLPPVCHWLRSLQTRFWPRRIVAVRGAPGDRNPYQSDRLNGLFQGREAGPVPACYVCENFVCQRPLTATAEVEQLFSKFSLPQ